MIKKNEEEILRMIRDITSNTIDSFALSEREALVRLVEEFLYQANDSYIEGFRCGYRACSEGAPSPVINPRGRAQ
jgi:hypothetical protein